MLQLASIKRNQVEFVGAMRCAYQAVQFDDARHDLHCVTGISSRGF